MKLILIVQAQDSFSAVRSIIGPIPVSLMPAEEPATVDVDMYAPDGKTTIKGTATLTSAGVLTISTNETCKAGDAWGLVKKLVIVYKTAKSTQ